MSEPQNGHVITRDTLSTTAWPRALQPYYAAAHAVLIHRATCSCGWSAESGAPVVVQHLTERHMAEATPEEPTGSN